MLQKYKKVLHKVHLEKISQTIKTVWDILKFKRFLNVYFEAA
jgi:hypothetical protein